MFLCRLIAVASLGFFFLCGVFPQPCLCKDVLIEEGPGLKDLCPERLGRRKA